MNDRLWSPQMRKWTRDAERHGLEIGWEKIARPRRQLDEAGQLRSAPVTSPFVTTIYYQVMSHHTYFYARTGLH